MGKLMSKPLMLLHSHSYHSYDLLDDVEAPPPTCPTAESSSTETQCAKEDQAKAVNLEKEDLMWQVKTMAAKAAVDVELGRVNPFLPPGAEPPTEDEALIGFFEMKQLMNNLQKVSKLKSTA